MKNGEASAEDAPGMDSRGALYGTTASGGDFHCTINGSNGCGTVFRLTAVSGCWTASCLSIERFGSPIVWPGNVDTIPAIVAPHRSKATNAFHCSISQAVLLIGDLSAPQGSLARRQKGRQRRSAVCLPERRPGHYRRSQPLRWRNLGEHPRSARPARGNSPPREEFGARAARSASGARCAFLGRCATAAQPPKP